MISLEKLVRHLVQRVTFLGYIIRPFFRTKNKKTCASATSTRFFLF